MPKEHILNWQRTYIKLTSRIYFILPYILGKTLSRRLEAYNRQLDMIDRMEEEGSVVCIRPERTMEVTRMEKDTAKLERLYEEGFKLGEEFCLKYKGE